MHNPVPHHSPCNSVSARSEVDDELRALTSEFRQIPVRIVLEIFLSYLWAQPSVRPHDAAIATRDRLLDAYLVS